MAKTSSKEEQKWVGRFCYECENCTEVTEKDKLSIQGKPILGRCPYWTESKSVLLSQPACKTHFSLRHNPPLSGSPH